MIPMYLFISISHATEAGAFLVTHNDHFRAIPGLLLWP